MKLNRRQGVRRWVPLQCATPVPKTSAQMDELVAHFRQVFPDFSEVRVRQELADLQKPQLWKNDRYQVAVLTYQGGPGDMFPIVHLSIRTLDRRPVRDWRDCQRIKNQLVGAECEGIELYPAESRLVDTANQYHLFCVADPAFRFPFGWHMGRHVDGSSGGGAVQRPIDDYPSQSAASSSDRLPAGGRA